MRPYFVMELKRAVFSVPFLGGIIAATIAGLTGVIPELKFAEMAGSVYVFLRFHESILAILAPVIATIPFAQSYAVERNSGFSRALMQRMPASEYKAYKLTANALSGGLVLAIPMAGMVIWATSSVPMIPDPNGDPSFFGSSFTPAPYAFMWLVVALSFAFGGTFATLGLALSTLFRNPFYANFLPLGAYLIPTMTFAFLGMAYLEPTMMWIPRSHIDTSIITVSSQYLVFVAASVMLFICCFRLREE